MRKSWNARVFVERLGLNPYERHVNIPCPFHPDSRPSMSIDLDKGVYYCHGACEEPRGGGAIRFLMRWARFVLKKPITESEARRQLRRVVVLPDAKTLARELLRKELFLFVEYAASKFADRCKMIRRAIDDVDAYVADHPYERHDTEIWDMLVRCHRELQWCEHAFVACNESTHTLRSDVIAIFLECKRRDWWNPEIEAYAQRMADMKEYEHRVNREFDETREQCRRENPSRPKTPIPKRTPVH